MESMKKTKQEFITMMSRIGKQWGLGEPIGRIWGLLLFEGSPLSQREIARECNYSLSLVSPSLAFLEKMGLISVVGRRGKERLYRATSSFLEAFEKILNNFVQLSIEPVIELLSKAKEAGSEHTKKKLENIINEYKKAVILSNFFLWLIKTKKALTVKQLVKVLKMHDVYARTRKAHFSMPAV
ncbi:MAG: ArsR family transcriptional regulator [Candidatus Diapherotrites archaeon]|nr:ArsR family transcriptional regulator [Candidatus Diapherotrites archaeon]